MAQETDRHFYLQAVDGPSGFAVLEVECGCLSLEDLRRIIEPAPGDKDLRNSYQINQNELEEIRHLSGVDFDPAGYDVHLTSWSPRDSLPYRVHPNRELILMLSGVKPLTFLTDSIPGVENFVGIPEYLFDPHVTRGLLVKREYCVPNKADALSPLKGFQKVRGLRCILYALVQEAWRIDAFILIHNTAEKLGWNYTLTRLEGTLLGYEEWQNDAFIETMRKRRHISHRL